MTTDAVGGVWNYSVDLAGELARRGIEVTLAVMGPRPDATQCEVVARLEGVRLAIGEYPLEWMGCSWDEVDAAGEWLQELEQRIAPDVVHLNGYVHAVLDWQAPIIGVAHSCVLSWWRGVHGVDAPAEWNQYRDRVTRGLDAADIVVAPTHAMLSALETHYGALPRARVIPNGSARIDTAATRHESLEPPFILSAGRTWDRAKNVESLCAVAPDLPWPVCVAGDAQSPDGQGPTFRGILSLGRMAPERLFELMQLASLYVLPARYEPFGLSILEAAHAGCPLVLGDIDSLREVWDDAALFVAPDDTGALLATLRRVIADTPLRADLAARAMRRAAAFSLRAMTDAYCDAYCALLPLGSV